MPQLNYRNIESVTDRCGGQPVVAGTRVRVATIFGCYRQGLSVDQILEAYPHLKPADIHDAIAYAYDHLGQIDADLAADDEQRVKANHAGQSAR
jgi:uncharacterized protein (DUF433 family)